MILALCIHALYKRPGNWHANWKVGGTPASNSQEEISAGRRSRVGLALWAAILWALISAVSYRGRESAASSTDSMDPYST